MKVAICYQNVELTTVTFLASANESLVTAYLYTPSLTLVTGQHTACPWLEPLAQIYIYISRKARLRRASLLRRFFDSGPSMAL